MASSIERPSNRLSVIAMHMKPNAMYLYGNGNLLSFIHVLYIYLAVHRCLRSRSSYMKKQGENSSPQILSSFRHLVVEI